MGHTLISSTIAVILLRKEYLKTHLKFIIISVLIISIFPDLDLLWDLSGHTPLIHHTFTHSFFAPLFLSLLYSIFALLKKIKIHYELVMLFCIIYILHLGADYYAIDLKEPIGLMLFWPFWDTYYISSHPFFMPLFKETISQFFLKDNFYALASELLLVFPLVCAIFLRWYLDKKSFLK
jgi:membrane-bound metal-dependent hydrolase YbcI (DUF457 family)